MMLFKCSLWLVIAIGLGGRQFMESKFEQERVLEIVVIFVVYLFCRYVLHLLEKSCGYASRRLMFYGTTLLTLLTLGYLFAHHMHYFRYMVSLYYLAAAVAYFWLLLGYNDTVIEVFKLHDMMLGHLIFTALLIMSVLQIGYLQTWLLYHNALSSGVVIEDVLKYARRTKETANIEEDQTIDNLRHQLEEQKQMIKHLMEGTLPRGNTHRPPSHPTPSAVAMLPSLIHHQHSQQQQQPLLGGGGLSRGASKSAHKYYGATSSDHEAHSSALKMPSTADSHSSGSDEVPRAVKSGAIKTKVKVNHEQVQEVRQGTSPGGSGVVHVSSVASTASGATPAPPPSAVPSAITKKKSSEANLNLLAAAEPALARKKSSDSSMQGLTMTGDFVFSQPTTMPPR
jgi:hypothetical protein